MKFKTIYYSAKYNKEFSLFLSHKISTFHNLINKGLLHFVFVLSSKIKSCFIKILIYLHVL